MGPSGSQAASRWPRVFCLPGLWVWTVLTSAFLRAALSAWSPLLVGLYDIFLVIAASRPQLTVVWLPICLRAGLSPSASHKSFLVSPCFLVSTSAFHLWSVSAELCCLHLSSFRRGYVPTNFGALRQSPLSSTCPRLVLQSFRGFLWTI